MVGIGCRFPGGASSPDAFWRVLRDGIDAISEVPRSRWDIDAHYDPDPATPGRMYTRHGGFLDDVAGFDAPFFRITPREAQSMDPQQRLLLEVTWDAVADAGIPMDRLRGTNTGVFIGITTNDYGRLLLQSGAEALDAYFFTGNPANAAAGRLAYTFGFEGPALALDTACSSSLVAVHQACTSLRTGESGVAIVGGVNLLLAPDATIAVCRTRALSPTGRCHTFAAQADGFVRSEGCGVVVLKRLSDALAAGDRIRAVIRGTAVNQDGASSGFTVPNGAAQQAVIRAALGDLDPGTVDYLEAHGTGTPLGDPVEVSAATSVLGGTRTAAAPLRIGSVKTNIGHTEAAAGIAALIKTVLALEHGVIPAHLHCAHPSPLIDWTRVPVQVPQQALPWPSSAHPRRAGVSAFGASGTNAHAVLEQAPPPAEAAPSSEPTGTGLLLLSAASSAALADVADTWQHWLHDAAPDQFLVTCRASATQRTHLRHRAAISAQTPAAASESLGRFAARLRSGDDDGRTPATPPRVSVHFGDRAAVPGGDADQAVTALSRHLFASAPAYREGLVRCAATLAPLLGVEPAALWPTAPATADDPMWRRARHFAHLSAVSAMLTAWGVRPTAVWGDGDGEVSAAVCAGALTPDEGAHLLAARLRPDDSTLQATADRITAITPALTWVSARTGGVVATLDDMKTWHRSVAADAHTPAAALTVWQQLPADVAVVCAATTLLAPADGDEAQEGQDPLHALLSALFRQGATLDWRAVWPETPHVPLPPYPFQHAPYWVPSPSRAMEALVTTPLVPERSAPSHASVLDRLRAFIADLLKMPPADVNVDVPFLEMGADSLVMVDAIGIIEKEFGVKLAIRRFFEDLATIDALAAHIASAMPASFAADTTTAATPPSAAASAPAATLNALPQTADGTSLAHLLSEQTALLTQFLTRQQALLQVALGQPSTVPSPAPPSPVPAVPPPPATGSAASGQAPAATMATAAVAPRQDDETRAKPMMPFGNPVEIRGRGLNDAQRAHMEALVARYIARTPTSKRLTQEYRGVLADSRTTVGFRLSTKEMLYPIWGDRTDGARLWDVDGNEYLDYTMGFGVHLFGHKPPFIQSLVQEEFDRAVELGARSPLVGEVASLFTELTGLDRVAFCNSGTEAVMAAVRLARAATGRDKIVIFTSAYHGHSDITLARAQQVNGQLTSAPMAPGVPAGIASDAIVLEYGRDDALDIIRQRRHEIAAVMVEPVQSRHLTLQPRAFLHALRALTREIDAALIFDEMITGFRADLGGAQAYFDVKADLATYGKIVGGGLPIGLVGGSARFLDGIDGGMWQYGDGSFPAADRTAFGGTFCQHPLAMAGAAAVLRHLKAEGPGLQHRLNERTTRLVDTLNRHFRDEAYPIEATNFSSLFRFEFSSNLDLLFYEMLARGIYIWEWRSCFLSTAHSDADVERFIDVVQDSLHSLRGGGFTPRPGGAPRRSGPTREPLTPAQRQLALLTTSDPSASLAYHISTTLDLRGVLDIGRLRQALQRVVNRHDALRTTLAADGDAQCVHDRLAVDIPCASIPTADAADGAAALEDWLRAQGDEPIDLVRGPIVRARLAALAPEHHVLVVTAHHLFADGITMGLVLRDLAEFYNDPAASMPPPMQFRDYATAADAARTTDEMRAHATYWRERFADAVPRLELPTDAPRPARQTYSGTRIRTTLPPTTVASLRALSRRHGCTLNMTMLAAFAAQMHRVADADDLILGTSVTGRPFPGSLDVAGYCTHLAPVRSILTGNPAFSALLASTRTTLLDLFDHQDLPFAELIDAVPGARAAGGLPMITAVFNMEPVSTLPTFRGLTVQPRPQVVRYVPFDLFINVTDAGDDVVVEADVNTDLFDPETIERWLHNYAHLLAAIVDAPETPVRALPIMADAERVRVVDTWNDTAQTFEGGFVPDLFVAQVQAHPEAPAVTFNNTTLTYAALDARTNQVAQWLQTVGVGVDVPVAIYAERSLELVVAILGVLKAGGAWVPLDPALPPDRVAHLLQDIAPPVVLTQSHLRDRLPPTAARVCGLDAAPEVDACVATAPGTAVTGEQLAYIIFTSGSTGQPKGAMNTHAGLRNRLLWMQDAYGLQADDVVLQKTPFSFDVSVWEFLWPLITGARLVLAAPGGHRDPDYLASLIARERVTTLHFVPSMLQLFLETADLPLCGALRRIIASGEALPAPLVRRCADLLGVPLHNLYGPTEASIDVSAWTCVTDAAVLARGVPIGRPIANTQLYVLDADRQPVPIGVHGDLWIGGVGVGRGYWRQDARTADAFIPDPFRPQLPGARLYRTGDRARLRADGLIDYLGRRDGQIKMRGFRIELGEIETTLLAAPGVLQAAVVGVTDADGRVDRLAAYVVPTVGTTDRDTLMVTLRETLAAHLPDYMVPTIWHLLDALPRLTSGKIDRRQLPSASAPVTTTVPPRPGAETTIATIWEAVLQRRPVGATDNFFDLGGHSLTAAQITARLSHEFKTTVSLADFFAAPTVRGLAATLIRGERPAWPDVVPVPAAASYPVSRAQRRFWLQDQLASQDAGRTQPAAFLMDGPLDREVFQRAILALVDRHEILRTLLVEIDGELRQRVLPDADAACVISTQTAPSDEDLHRLLDATVTEEAALPLNLAHGPVFRVRVVALSADRHLCVCTLHHAVTDGWSTALMQQELLQIYEALHDGRAPSLAPLPFQYRDVAAWQQRLLAAREDDARYWRAQLAGAPGLELPARAPRGAGHRHAVYRTAVPAPLLRAFDGVVRRQGATRFMGLLVALRATIYRHTAQEEFCVGTPMAGRVLPSLETQLGPYLNVVALRDRTRGDDSFALGLSSARTTTLQASAHQMYPFDQIMDDLSLRRAPGRNPLFDVGLTLQNQADAVPSVEGGCVQFTPLTVDADTGTATEAATDLWLIATPDADALTLALTYDAERFDAAFARTFTDDVVRVLDAAVANPDVRLAEIPLTQAPRAAARVTVDLRL